MAAQPTPRPWAIGRLGESLWIEGAAGSAATDTLPGDRKIVADMHLVGDADEDARIEADAVLIIERVNGGE